MDVILPFEAGVGHCSSGITTCERRSLNNSFLPHQAAAYSSSQQTSPLSHRHVHEEINANHLLVSPTMTTTDEEHRIYRGDQISPNEKDQKDYGLNNSSVASAALNSLTTATNQHSQTFSENYYDTPAMATIDQISPSSYYTQHQHTSSRNPTYNSPMPIPDNILGERNSVQSMFDSATESYNYIIAGAGNSLQPPLPPPPPPAQCTTTATCSEVSSSLADDSLSSSSVAMYHFNNSFIDFTNPSDIFQFDRVYSAPNEVDTESSIYCQQQLSPSGK